MLVLLVLVTQGCADIEVERVCFAESCGWFEIGNSNRTTKVSSADLANIWSELTNNPVGVDSDVPVWVNVYGNRKFPLGGYRFAVESILSDNGLFFQERTVFGSSRFMLTVSREELHVFSVPKSMLTGMDGKYPATRRAR